MAVRIALAGRVAIESDGDPVPTEGVRIAGWVALAYLISQRHRPVRQDELAEVIWGEELPRSWATMVRGIVSKLRSALAAAGMEADAISTAFGCYQFNLGADAAVDVEEAAADVALAEAALAAGRASEARDHASRARSVASAQFLPGASGVWVERRQRELADLRVRALEAVSQAAASTGATAEAIAAAEEALKLEPLRESGHLRLISAHVAAGNRAEALRAYEQCRRLLAEELGVKPSTAIEAEYLRILAEEEQGPERARLPAEARTLPAAFVLAAQGPFIGRSREFEKLQSQWARSLRGGRLAVAVAGEPGMGKTRLLAEFARAVHAAGGRVLYGRCDEEATVPYQPVADVVRLALGEVSARELAGHVEAWGGELARLVPDMVSRLPEVPLPATGDPQTERWRMFEAVDAFLSDLSASGPVLVALDDLHWAGQPTLALLRHLLRSTRPASLLFVGTYRQTEVAAEHGLASLLADLRRDGTGSRVTLEGLPADDVGLLLGSVTGGPVHERSLQFVQSLHQTTQGNPFFVGEVLRHLAAIGALGPDTTPAIGELESAVPEGVREVVTRRLLRLAASSNRVLAVAAVCGAEFEEAILDDLEGPDAVLDALDEGLAARLITPTADLGRYTFCHALVRHTIYDQLGPARRARLHRRVGEALERRYGTRGPHLGALAHHFSLAATAGVADKAADYALAAAQAALGQLAFEETLVLLRMGLTALDAGPPDPTRKGRLLTTLGVAYVRYDNYPALQEVGHELLELWDRSGAVEHLGNGLWFRLSGPPQSFDPELRALLDEALDRLDDRQPDLRAHLLIQLARAEELAGRSGEAAAREAVALARRASGSPGLLRSILYAFVNFLRWRGEPSDLPEWMALADEIVAIEDHIPTAVGNGVRVRAMARLRTGDRDGFETDLAEMARRREKSPSPSALGMVLRFGAILAALDGPPDRVEALARELHGARGHGGVIDHDLELAHMLFFVRREQGRIEEYLPELQSRFAQRPAFALNQAVLGLALGEIGDDDGAARAWETLKSQLDQLPASWDRAGALALIADVLAVAGDPGPASELYESLRPHSGLFVNAAAPAFHPMAADRALGLLAAVIGDLDVAGRHFEAAIDLEERMRAVGLAARTRYTYGRALLRNGGSNDRHRAGILLEEALAAAESLGLPGLARAVRHQYVP